MSISGAVTVCVEHERASPSSAAAPGCFLDGIRFISKRRSVLRRLFPIILDQLDRSGLTITRHSDFARLAATNAAAVACGTWDPLFPAVDPARCPAGLAPDRACWISATDATGRVVATVANRLYEVPSFGRALADLSALYDDPRSVPPGETLTCGSALALETGGRVALSTGGWLHPDVRSKGLFRAMVALARALALVEWDIDWWVAMVDTPLWDRHAAAYGRVEAEPGILWRELGLHDIEMVFLRASEADILADAASYLESCHATSPSI